MTPLPAPGLFDLVAAARPAEFVLPLFLHVLGAVTLTGAAAAAATVAALTGPDVAAWARRLSFRIALLVALPAYVVMRTGAEWIRVREFGGAPSQPGWVDLGYIMADGGFVVLAAAVIVLWQSARRQSRRLATAGASLLAVAVAAWVFTAWAMAAKPF